jgi:4-aminobutyrate aminotransferase-like enzyme
MIRAASENLDHLSSCMLSTPVLALADRLTSLLPVELSKVMFFSTGSESNEAAIRLAKVVTGKFEFIALGQSWHGMTLGAQGAQYQAGRKGHGKIDRRSCVAYVLTCIQGHQHLGNSCSHSQMHTGQDSEIPTGRTTGNPNSTVAGNCMTKPRAARLQPVLSNASRGMEASTCYPQVICKP